MECCPCTGSKEIRPSTSQLSLSRSQGFTCWESYCLQYECIHVEHGRPCRRSLPAPIPRRRSMHSPGSVPHNAVELTTALLAAFTTPVQLLLQSSFETHNTRSNRFRNRTSSAQVNIGQRGRSKGDEPEMPASSSAPPNRPKRSRTNSSALSRSSRNIEKTEVIINVYDLLPVSKEPR